MSTTREDALERRAFAERFATALREGELPAADDESDELPAWLFGAAS